MVAQTSSAIDFDAYEDEAALINDVCANTGDLASLESTLGSLTNQLDAVCLDTDTIVERAIQDISVVVPRLSFDLQLLRENALLLRMSLDAIRRKTDASLGEDGNVKTVMHRIRAIDVIKSQMEASRDVLREAESWSTLESEVTAYISDSAYHKAASRLSEASKSILVFENTPEYEARRSLMVSLQNGLEATLSSLLVNAIKERDTSMCSQFFEIFEMIERESEFRGYYYGSRRAAVTHEWQNAALAESTADKQQGTSSIPLSDFLPIFYDHLTITLAEETAHVAAIFPDPIDTLAAYLQSSLDSLSPSFSQRLTELANHHGPSLLTELVKIYQATNNFARSAEGILSRMRLSTSNPAVTESPNSTTSVPPSTPSRERRSSASHGRRLSRRRSSRLSISLHDTFTASASNTASEPQAWESTLFEPFLDWQHDYETLESRYLYSMAQSVTQEIMATAILGAQDSHSNAGVKQLLEHLSSLLTLVDAAHTRMMAFTAGYAFPPYLRVCDGLLSTFLTAQRSSVLMIQREQESRRKNLRTDLTSGLEYTEEDWATFGKAIKLLEACQGLADQISTYEATLRARGVTIAHSIRDQERQVVGDLSRGAMLLLSQSSLNSAEIVSLLDSLLPDRPPETPNTPLTATTPQPPSKSPPALLPTCKTSLMALTKACQTHLHTSILSPLISAMSSYPFSPMWTSSSSSRLEHRGAIDLQVPTFSLSPSEIITRVGEGLFNLPGVFEVYAEGPEGSALGIGIEHLPMLDDTVLKAALETVSLHPGLSKHSHRMSVFNVEDLHKAASSIPHTTITTLWLHSLVNSLFSHFSTLLVKIDRLSNHGKEQLKSDLGYLLNIGTTLDVKWKTGEKWIAALEGEGDGVEADHVRRMSRDVR